SYFYSLSLLLQVLTYFLLRFFFFIDTATTEIYTLSLHDALPICWANAQPAGSACSTFRFRPCSQMSRISAEYSIPATPAIRARPDRKSTRLNSSHVAISYAVFCLKKKKIKKIEIELGSQNNTLQ